MSSINYLPAEPSYRQNPALVATDSKLFLKSAHAFVDSSRKVAHDILRPSTTGSNTGSSNSIGRVHVHHHHYGYGYSPFWGRPVYVVESPRRSRRNEDEKDRAFRAFVGIAAAIIGAVAYFAVGVNLGRSNEAEEELTDIRSFKREVRDIRHSTTQYDNLLPKLSRISELKENIFKRIKSNAMWDLAGTVAIAAASTLVVIGAIVASYPLMTIGAVVGLGAGAAMLFKKGFDSTERHHYHDAREILRVIDELPNY